MCSCLQRPLDVCFCRNFQKGLKFLIPGIWQAGPHMSTRQTPWRVLEFWNCDETADARDQRCEVRVQVWPCVDPSVKLSCARLSTNFQRTDGLLEKRKHQLTKQKADYKTMSGTEWNRNRICSQLLLLHAQIFWWLSKSRMCFMPLELISVVGCLEIQATMTAKQQHIATPGQCHGAHDDGLGTNQAGHVTRQTIKV